MDFEIYGQEHDESEDIAEKLIKDRKIALISSFLVNLYNIVADPDTNEIVSWNTENETSDELDDQSFVIKDQTTFCDVVLPQYFKHTNFNSFIRQLNLYSFKKINRRELTTQIYQHPCF